MNWQNIEYEKWLIY